MRIVCDTNVLVSGLIWGGTPGRVWDRIVSRQDRLCISRAMVTELARVLNYPRITVVIRKRNLTARDIVAAIIDASDVVWPKPLHASVIRNDPDYDEVLACADAAGASRIVTGDQHLLELALWNDIRIVTPANYLAQYE
jgi:putative PIN family toxin of toxin-antitoxin system